MKNRMKRMIPVFLCLLLCFSLTACGGTTLEDLMEPFRKDRDSRTEEEDDDERESRTRDTEDTADDYTDPNEDTQPDPLPAEDTETEPASPAETEPEPRSETETEPESTPVSEPSDTAEEEPATPAPEGSTEPGRPQLKTGDILAFGNYEQDNDESNGKETLLWRVLAFAENDTKALLISVYSLQNIQFDENNESQGWAASTLRAWLNGEFSRDAFTAEEWSMLVPTSASNTFAFSEASPDSADWVFCLSADDVRMLFSSQQDRIAKNSAFAEAEMKRKMVGSWFYPNTPEEVEATVAEWNRLYGDNCSWWWLKEPAGGGISAEGEIRGSVDRRDLNSIRPSVWVDLDKLYR